MKSIIGIIARPGISEEGNKTFYVHKDLTDRLIMNEAIPISIIPLVSEELYNKDISNTSIYGGLKNMIPIISICDGIIFQGGDDFYDYDLKIMKYLYDNDIPTLGICLGMQTMAHLFGGKIVDVANHKSHNYYVHEVILDEGSMLYNLLKFHKFKVNSRHKSQIMDTRLRICGYSDDGVIEAIEAPKKKFFIGIQWHPESLKDDVLQNEFFKRFLDITKGEK